MATHHNLHAKQYEQQAILSLPIQICFIRDFCLTIHMGKLFENLQYIVVDEIHTYKGVFGSHFANLMRRLKRICSFYGSNPQFICCSATIHNPKELAETIFELPFTIIDNNGAPRGKKHFVIYNPPVVDKALGIRASAIKEAASIGSLCVKNNVSTIIFCRSRLRVEIIATYLKEKCNNYSIAAYRGGYLPNERRQIEKGLREKKINAVVSTNALELGIDIGMLDCAISVGYPALLHRFSNNRDVQAVAAPNHWPLWLQQALRLISTLPDILILFLKTIRKLPISTLTIC
jgi:ATP-dependent helicase YprA (DUF1998 family)